MTDARSQTKSTGLLSCEGQPPPNGGGGGGASASTDSDAIAFHPAAPSQTSLFIKRLKTFSDHALQFSSLTELLVALSQEVCRLLDVEASSVILEDQNGRFLSASHLADFPSKAPSASFIEELKIEIKKEPWLQAAADSNEESFVRSFRLDCQADDTHLDREETAASIFLGTLWPKFKTLGQQFEIAERSVSIGIKLRAVLLVGRSGGPFSQEDLFHLTLIAEWSALHIERLRMYEAQRDALARSEEYLALLDSLLMTAPIGFALLDKNLCYARVNAALQRSNEISHADIIGKRVGEDSPTGESLVPLLQHVLDTGEPVLNKETSFEFPPGSGNARHYLTSYYQVATQLHEVLGVGIVMLDVTERKLTEHELLRAKEEADAANRAKTDFLANMSHEIRTPLGAILGFAELMSNPSLEAHERQNCIHAIRRNGELLTRIINEILDLSKIEAGKLEVEREKIFLSEFITNISSLLKLQAEEKGLRLTIGSEGPVPSHIVSDPIRLHQILINIIGNAIKFTERGSVNVTVKLTDAPDKAEESVMLAFEVSDSGIGIAEDAQKRLFLPFSQADTSTTRRFGGTGLGLALSRRLASLLGGKLELTETAPGVGSTFTLFLNIGNRSELILLENGLQGNNPPQPQVHSPTPLEPSKSDKLPRLDGIQVLLVEDAPDNQLIVSRFLKLSGAQVDFAANGQEGVLKALAEDFDIVLMDIQMPVLDGCQATRLLRKEGYQKPVIALTAHAMKEERERCLQSGCSDHLTKPVNRKALIDIIYKYAKQNGEEVATLQSSTTAS